MEEKDMALEEMILDALKKNVESVCGVNGFIDTNRIPITNQKPVLYKRNYAEEKEYYYSDKLKYYFENYEDNLYSHNLGIHKQSYIEASGHELSVGKYGVAKMATIKSSSALLFNTLGEQNKVSILPNDLLPDGEYHIEYEKPMPAITRPAYIDALMENKDSMIFVESKFLEYLGSPKSLKKAYLNYSNYKLSEYTNNQKALEAFQKIFRENCKDIDTDRAEYESKNGTYDVFQILIHALAMATYLMESTKIPRKVILVNSVWHINNDDIFGDKTRLKKNYDRKWQNEEAGAKYFIENYMNRISDIYQELFDGKVEFGFVFVEWAQFRKMIKMDDGRKNYLKRYEL